jgi:hypothetical protein
MRTSRRAPGRRAGPVIESRLTGPAITMRGVREPFGKVHAPLILTCSPQVVKPGFNVLRSLRHLKRHDVHLVFVRINMRR